MAAFGGDGEYDRKKHTVLVVPEEQRDDNEQPILVIGTLARLDPATTVTLRRLTVVRRIDDSCVEVNSGVDGSPRRLSVALLDIQWRRWRAVGCDNSEVYAPLERFFGFEDHELTLFVMISLPPKPRRPGCKRMIFGMAIVENVGLRGAVFVVHTIVVDPLRRNGKYASALLESIGCRLRLDGAANPGGGAKARYLFARPDGHSLLFWLKGPFDSLGTDALAALDLDSYHRNVLARKIADAGARYPVIYDMRQSFTPK